MFKIFSNNGAIMEHQMTKEISKVSARTILKEKIDSELSKINSPYFRNSSDAIKNSKDYKRSYEQTLPEKLSPVVENEMWKRAKHLKDEFTVGMLSREELHPTKQFMENGTTKYVVDEERMRTLRSSEREMTLQRTNEPKIKEFKNLMRHLDPNNPNAGDVEKYRPKDRKN